MARWPLAISKPDKIYWKEFCACVYYTTSIARVMIFGLLFGSLVVRSMKVLLLKGSYVQSYPVTIRLSIVYFTIFN